RSPSRSGAGSRANARTASASAADCWRRRSASQEKTPPPASRARTKTGTVGLSRRAAVLPCRARCYEHEIVVGVNVVHVLRRHELVFGKHGRRHGPVVQNVERQAKDGGSVFLRKVRN